MTQSKQSFKYFSMLNKGIITIFLELNYLILIYYYYVSKYNLIKLKIKNLKVGKTFVYKI